jgi:hypothetical protein
MSGVLDFGFSLKSTLNRAIDTRFTGATPDATVCYPGLIHYDETAKKHEYWDPVNKEFKPFTSGSSGSGTRVARDAVSDKQPGMLWFETDGVGTYPFYYWNGSAWVKLLPERGNIPEGVGDILDGVAQAEVQAALVDSENTTVYILDLSYANHPMPGTYALHLHLQMEGDRFQSGLNRLYEPGKYHLDISIHTTNDPTARDPSSDTKVAETKAHWRDTHLESALSTVHKREATGAYYVCVRASDGGPANRAQTAAVTRTLSVSKSYFKVMRVATKAEMQLEAVHATAPPGIGAVVVGTLTYTNDDANTAGHAPHDTWTNIFVANNVEGAPYLLQLKLAASSAPTLYDKRYPRGQYRCVVWNGNTDSVPVVFNQGIIQSARQTCVSFVHKFDEPVTCYLQVKMDDGGANNRIGAETSTVFSSTSSYFKLTRLLSTGTGQGAVGDDIQVLALHNGVPRNGILPRATFGQSDYSKRYPVINNVGLQWQAYQGSYLNWQDAGKSSHYSTPLQLPEARSGSLLEYHNDPPLDRGRLKVSKLADRPDGSIANDAHVTNIFDGYFRNRDDDGNMIFTHIQFRVVAVNSQFTLVWDGQPLLNQGTHVTVSQDTNILNLGLNEMFRITLITCNHNLSPNALALKVLYRLKYADQYKDAAATEQWFGTLTDDDVAGATLPTRTDVSATDVQHESYLNNDGLSTWTQTPSGTTVAYEGPFFCFTTGW